MTKMKLLTVLITALVLLAMPAAPAGAWFKSRNEAKTTGSVKLGKTENSAKEVIATANVEGLDAERCSGPNEENIKLRSEEGGMIEEGLELA